MHSRFADREKCPSPEEIRRMTAEIRKGWSREEHLKRAGMARQALLPYVWAEPRGRVSCWTEYSV